MYGNVVIDCRVFIVVLFSNGALSTWLCLCNCCNAVGAVLMLV